MKRINPWKREAMRRHAIRASDERREAREAWQQLKPMLEPGRRMRRHDVRETSRCDCGHFWNDHGPQGCTLCPCTYLGVPV